MENQKGCVNKVLLFLGGTAFVAILGILGVFFDFIQIGQAGIFAIQGNQTDATSIALQEELLQVQWLMLTSEAGGTTGNVPLESTAQALETARDNLSATSTAEILALDAETYQPLRPHFEVFVGTGIFEVGTFSDGMAPHSEDNLWDIGHFDIQRIRQEEYPSGCDISRYDTNLVWISGSAGMIFSVNGENVGEYQIADDSHGYVFEWPIKLGDELCAVGFKPIGFSIILGRDIYWQYDSYCYRGHCR